MNPLMHARTRTHLRTVVNPGFNFLTDPDLEHHFSVSAERHDRTAAEVRKNWIAFVDPSVAEATAKSHMEQAKESRRMAEEQHQLHRPTPQMPKQIPDTYWSRLRIQLTLALICFVAAAGVLGWWLAQ